MKIFVVSTGRCGTVFMSEVFSKLTTVPSFHEPRPHCAGETMRFVNDTEGKQYPVAVRRELADKIKQVKADSVDGHYFESSQMFVKAYARFVFKAFENVALIYLHRNPIEVTMSYYKKKLGQPKQYNYWHLQSHWSQNILRMAEPQGLYADIFWECLEIKERFLALKAMAAKTFVMDFKRLNDVGAWKALFKHLNVPHRPFKALPDVNKNAVEGDTLKTLNGLLSIWDEPGADAPPATAHYDRLATFIDFGQKTIAKTQRGNNAQILG